ncbi:class I adenylate-forming enzyme family protein [Streptomyces sp. NBC_01716]|uniref:class I adenylate-forming enzyme family protein n=1 Tax=Streptomyces sp. NBC_01716 TaxID=2975917 RepID=UPI002E300CFE|nr:AMP-binding protein [Streptomyces sp. NBC_01716]
MGTAPAPADPLAVVHEVSRRLCAAGDLDDTEFATVVARLGPPQGQKIVCLVGPHRAFAPAAPVARSPLPDPEAERWTTVLTDAVLRDYLLPALRRHGPRRALVADGTTWTYAELEGTARKLAGHLLDLGVTPGTPVALILGNSAEYVIADLAIVLLGAARVPLNLMLSRDEQAFILADSGAPVCLVLSDRMDAVEAARTLGADPRLVIVGGPRDSWRQALAHPPLTALPAVPTDAPALIMYTGGTTGRPKGVLHHQRGTAANLLSHLLEMEIRADDVLMLTSPLPHSAQFLLQAALAKGASVFLENRFDPEQVLDRIEQDRVTYLFLVPTMIYRLLDAVTGRKTFDSGSLGTILYGAAPITADRLKQGLRTFGPVFMQLYAQSEAPNFLTRLRRDDHRLDPAGIARLASCGQAVVMADVRVVREDGSVCDPREVGEVTALTPYTMNGYLGRDAETAEVLRGGRLYTGDLGYLDEDGYLYLVDRKKDMIITGGLNVYSGEVEQALSQIPGVKHVAVAGIPHPDWGEAVVAFVVPDGTEVTPVSVTEEAHGRLTAYKRPKAVVFVPALPMTSVGKVDKKELRESWTEW